MKTLTKLIGTMATLAPVTSFAAEHSELSADNSGIFVWAFLGFCALIVVAQVIPAVMLATGMVKGVVDGIILDSGSSVDLNIGTKDYSHSIKALPSFVKQKININEPVVYIAGNFN